MFVCLIGLYEMISIANNLFKNRNLQNVMDKDIKCCRVQKFNDIHL
jgi:hypothetical protein